MDVFVISTKFSTDVGGMSKLDEGLSKSLQKAWTGKIFAEKIGMMKYL